tara:strand:+ start:97 stop:717 length:621 start_codon:yes stop_codon:yes gene_type:complete
MSSNITCKKDLLMTSLTDFYKKDNISKILPIVNGNSDISLRVIDWFVTNYAKKNNTTYDLFYEKNKEILSKQFIVYLNYKSQLKAYSKKQFDPFCRRERIEFYYDDSKSITTTVGQLNFFRWAIENGVMNYITDNLSEIEDDMNSSVRNLYNRNKSKKTIKSKTEQIAGNKNGSLKNKQRRKRKELSVSATRSVSKHNVKILVKFE